MKNTKHLERVPPRWETHQRLRFIEARLFWTGRINRGEIMEYFGISQPQSSKDLTLYQEIAPNNCYYDKSAKTYRSSDKFKPIFIDPNVSKFDGHLLLEDGILGWQPEIIRMPNLQRPVKAEIFRAILIATREKQAIRIRYQSMNSERPSWRWVSPAEWSHDGFRWHVHAYCENRNAWRDFVLGRIIETGESKDQPDSLAEDKAWDEWHTIIYEPHPELSEDRRKIIEQDYGMKNGRGTLKVQAPMLFYTLVHFGLDTDNRGPKAQHIVLVNKELRKIAGLDDGLMGEE